MFDFDGVIVDTFAFSFEIAHRQGGYILTEGEYRDYFNGNIYAKIDEGVEKPSHRMDSVIPFFQEYAPKLMETPPIEGVLELLQKLQLDGWRMVVVTSSLDDLVDRFLEMHDLRSYFDGIYGATVHKSKVEKIKMALKDTQTDSSEALFITDTLGDMHEARAVDVDSIGVSWGYHSVETLQKGGPTAIAGSLEELGGFIIDRTE
jgi:phosphoglycolate phosphatase